MSCLPPGNDISQGVDFPLVFTSGSTKGKNPNQADVLDGKILKVVHKFTVSIYSKEYIVVRC